MRRTLLTSFAAVIALTNGGTAFAGSTPRSDEHAKTSLTTGFSVKSLPVLKWRSPRSPEATLNVLLRSLPGKTGAPYRILRQQNDPVLRAAAQEWRLDIFGSGSAAEYLNEGNAGRALRTAVEPSQAMRLAQLEKSGRDYIDQVLAGVITLAPGDSLTSEAMSARIMGGSAIDGSSSYSTVLASRMIFTREIEGVPVVGAGSKVTVTFLNDGSIKSFRYDWPAYERTQQTQSLLNAAEILKRVQIVIFKRAGGPGMKLEEWPQPVPGDGPVDLGGNFRLERLVCGYYDPGFWERQADAPVQPGCYYHITFTSGVGQTPRAPHFREQCRPDSDSKLTRIGRKRHCWRARSPRLMRIRRAFSLYRRGIFPKETRPVLELRTTERFSASTTHCCAPLRPPRVLIRLGSREISRAALSCTTSSLIQLPSALRR